MKLCRPISPLAMTLVVFLALCVTPMRSAESITPPVEQSKVPIKVLYIIENPENFKNGLDNKLLLSSYNIINGYLRDQGRVRTHYNGDNYEKCAVNESCDKVVIRRGTQSITVAILCNDKKTTVDGPRDIPSGEISSAEEIDGILRKIGRVVRGHDSSCHTADPTACTAH